MNCYIINLDRSTERFSYMSRSLAALSLSITRVSAIDGDLLTESELARWQALGRVWSPMTTREVACFLSHRKAWKFVVEGKDPWAFVGEDDIHVADSFASFFSSFSWFPEDADIVKAETMRSRIEMSRKTEGAVSPHTLRRLYSDHTGAAGYFISRIAAKKLMRLSEQFCEPADRLLFSPGILSEQLTIYQLDPAICIQDHRLTDDGVGIGFLTEIPKMKIPKRKLKLLIEIVRPARQLISLVRWSIPFLKLNTSYKKVPISLNGISYN